MKILALSAWKGTGKDTVADYLIENHNFHKVSFAKPLKDYVMNKYSLREEYLYDPVLKDEPLEQYPVDVKDSFGLQVCSILKDELKSGFWTPRALLIMEGSIARAVHPYHWVDLALKYIGEQAPLLRHPNFVIPDLRYKNEAKVLSQGFHYGTRVETIRLNRFDSCSSTDASERDLDDWEGFDKILDLKGLTIPQVYELIEKELV